MLDFRVRTFLTACDTLNFTKAAKELCITQPAVSQHIRYLEQEYGAPLFVHEGKATRLTDAGAQLRDAMRQMATDEARLTWAWSQPGFYRANDLGFDSSVAKASNGSLPRRQLRNR